jgi:hypothetical protein
MLSYHTQLLRLRSPEILVERNNSIVLRDCAHRFRVEQRDSEDFGRQVDLMGDGSKSLHYSFW